MITVTGQLEIRCAYGAPWRIAYGQSAAREIPYHVVLKGVAILEDPEDESSRELGAGDIVLLPHGSSHVLHDGSGRRPSPAYLKEGANLTVSENAGTGDRLDMLCGRFFIAPPHDRLIRDYLPTKLVVRATNKEEDSRAECATDRLAGLVRLMRAESVGDNLGGYAMLNALSAALFALTLRVASESQQAPMGLLALAGHPRLAPAISAMFNDPARPWTLPELARRCSMSRATFMRHFQDKLGRSAHELLTDIRMMSGRQCAEKSVRLNRRCGGNGRLPIHRGVSSNLRSMDGHDTGGMAPSISYGASHGKNDVGPVATGHVINAADA